MVADEFGNKAIGKIYIQITPVNDAPNVADEHHVLYQGNAITIGGLKTATDVDGDTISNTHISTPAHGIVTQNLDGTLTYQSDLGYTGDDSFSYTVSDGNGGETTAAITINGFETVAAADDMIDVVAGRTAVLDVMANDAFNPDTDTIRVTSMPEQGNVTVNPDGTLALVLTDTSFKGLLSFTYEVADQAGNVSEARVNLNVTESPLLGGWGAGDYYMLQEGTDHYVTVERGENSRDVFVSGSSDAFSIADIAAREGVMKALLQAYG